MFVLIAWYDQEPNTLQGWMESQWETIHYSLFLGIKCVALLPIPELCRAVSHEWWLYDKGEYRMSSVGFAVVMICYVCHAFVRGHSHMYIYAYIIPRARTCNSFLFCACTICSLRVHLAQVLCPSHRATFATLLYKRIQITRQTILFGSGAVTIWSDPCGG